MLQECDGPVLPADLERLEPVEVPAVPIDRRGSEPQLRKPRKEDRQRHLHFKPRQRRADAEVDARTEGDIGGDGAGGIEAAGAGESRRIAVGGPKEEADPLTLAEA